MRMSLSLMLAIGIVAGAWSQQPSGGPSQLPLPPSPSTMNIQSAQAFVNQGKVFLYVTASEPVYESVTFTYCEPVQVKVLTDDGQGGKIEKNVTQTVTKQGTKTVSKYVFVTKQYTVTGNDTLLLSDATGRKLTDAEVLKALEKPAFIYEFKDQPHEAYLKSLKPETVVMRWKSQPVVPAVPQPARNGAMPVVPMPAKPQGEMPSATEKELVERTNAERKKAGVPNLVVDPLLLQAARQHSVNMARQDKLAHTLDDKGVAERLTELGYRWSGCGENIARGQRTPAQAIETWMNSDDHRENMLSTKYSRIGVAVVTAADRQRYWTMVLTQPR